MGWRSLPRIVQALLENGRPPETPVAATQWGTLPQQRTVTGTLATIVELGRKAGLSSPMVTVIGPVAGLRESMRWFDTRPLFGKRVLVTRSRTQASSLVQQLTEQGAEAVELPTIEILPPDDYGALDEALASVQRYQWLVLTSVNAVQAVFDRLRHAGKDARALGPVLVAAIGPATAEALLKNGIVADFVPDTYTTEAVADGFRRYSMHGTRALLPRSEIGQESLPEGLRVIGAQVDQVTAYRTVTPAEAKKRTQELLASRSIDVVTFTSSSTVRNLVELLGGDTEPLRDVLIATIGPSTSRTARELGLRVDLEAGEHTVSGLVQAVVNRYGAAPVGSSKEKG
jgi:uroporphyrinogen III methyltransferase/synthase